jgi:hypothetical protein
MYMPGGVVPRRARKAHVAAESAPAAIDTFCETSVPFVKLTVGRPSNSAIVIDGVLGLALF